MAFRESLLVPEKRLVSRNRTVSDPLGFQITFEIRRIWRALQ